MMLGKENAHGVWLPSETEDLDSIFEFYIRDKSFLDIGSGDGRILDLASKYTSEVQGIEIDSQFDYRVDTMRQDFFDENFESYEVIYYYLQGSNREADLVEKINSEFEGTLILYTKNVSNFNIANFLSKLKLRIIDAQENVIVCS